MARSKASTVLVSGKVLYLNNKDMLVQIRRSKEQGSMTDGLAAMLQSLTYRYSQTYRFVGYSFNEDMQAAALLSLMTSWHKFDPEVGSNPFAYYTQCIKNSFKQFLRNEKTHRDLRDTLLMHSGMSASLTYMDSEAGKSSDDRTYDVVEIDSSQWVEQRNG